MTVVTIVTKVIMHTTLLVRNNKHGFRILKHGSFQNYQNFGFYPFKKK